MAGTGEEKAKKIAAKIRFYVYSKMTILVVCFFNRSSLIRYSVQKTCVWTLKVHTFWHCATLLELKVPEEIIIWVSFVTSATGMTKISMKNSKCAMSK